MFNEKSTEIRRTFTLGVIIPMQILVFGYPEYLLYGLLYGLYILNLFKLVYYVFSTNNYSYLNSNFDNESVVFCSSFETILYSGTGEISNTDRYYIDTYFFCTLYVGTYTYTIITKYIV